MPLLAGLLGRQHGLEVHVLDRGDGRSQTRASRGARGQLPHRPRGDPQSAQAVAPGGVVCLTGVGASHDRPAESFDGSLATLAVLRNLVIFGSVNADRRHYYRAARALPQADRSWLEGLITRTLAPDEVAQALTRNPSVRRSPFALRPRAQRHRDSRT